MKIIFDRSQNKLKDYQFVLYTIGFVPRHPSNIFDVLPVIRLKSYVRVEVDD